MLEIWRHQPSGARYRVLVLHGRPVTAAGPVPPGMHPRRALGLRGGLPDNALVLLDMRLAPHEFVREYTTTPDGAVLFVGQTPR
jgi:hypothetical protein